MFHTVTTLNLLPTFACPCTSLRASSLAQHGLDLLWLANIPVWLILLSLGVLFLFSSHNISVTVQFTALMLLRHIIFQILLVGSRSHAMVCNSKLTNISCDIAQMARCSPAYLSLENLLFSIRAVPQMSPFHSGFSLCCEYIQLIQTETVSLMKRR